MNKIIIVAAFTALCMLASCKREGPASATDKNKHLKALGASSYDEMVQMYTSMNYEIRLGAKANLGLVPSRDKRYQLTGSIPGTYPNPVSIILPTGTYQLNQQVSIDGGSKNQVFVRSGVFDQLYSTNVPVTLLDGRDSYSGVIYSSPPLVARKLTQGSSIHINRTGNTMTWNADPNNAIGILLQYKLYSSSDLTNPASLMQINYINVPDNGSYNIDNLLSDPNVKAIDIGLYRGNAVEFTSSSTGKNFVIDIISTDFHIYFIN